MDRLQRASVLLALNEQLRAAGSWAGETHMQKATYFLQHLMGVPLAFDFILYKHGPFSFDLRDELTAMRKRLAATERIAARREVARQIAERRETRELQRFCAEHALTEIGRFRTADEICLVVERD